MQFSPPPSPPRDDVLIKSSLKHATASIESQIEQLDSDIERIKALQKLSAARLREKALEAASLALEQAQLSVQETASESWFKRAKRRAAREHLNTAQALLDKETARIDAPDVQRQRNEYVARYNAKVDVQSARLPGLREQKTTLQGTQREIEGLQQALQPAFAALDAHGWLDSSFRPRLQEIRSLVEQEAYPAASEWVNSLLFQRKPDDEFYAELASQARQLREHFYATHHGIPATGQLPTIAEASAQLAVGSMSTRFDAQIQQCALACDKWEMLTQLTQSPREFKVDALWVIYWAMLQCEQEMADYLYQADSHEDPLNGRFSQMVEHWLGRWATPCFPGFGYPQGESYVGTLQLSNTEEESRLGADIGIIVALDIGALKCQKVLLLQAKRAHQGRANIGSEKGQLSKLARRPAAGYYLFYHQTPGLTPTVPTVACAKALCELVEKSRRDPAAKSLEMDVRLTGWDWASFFTFGVCDAQSGIGEHFDDAQDALRILGDGDSGKLPKYLYVLAIDHDGIAPLLRDRLRQHYVDLSQGQASAQKDTPDQTQDFGGQRPS
ncbi:hypothetical protein [Pseudomonas sp. UFMG81]|uniref:hypothetical protein n=1 Tax=Pseudomonas sp. UFMG81 TaxID=2745936 RepID=UPI00188EAD83|nr:hypothetical protein [Pseudomonas sp. UFMG81]